MRCTFFFHKWTRFTEEKLKDKKTGVLIAIYQKRSCEKCGFVQMKKVWGKG